MHAGSLSPSIFIRREKTVCKARDGGGGNEWVFPGGLTRFLGATLHPRDEAK